MRLYKKAHKSIKKQNKKKSLRWLESSRVFEKLIANASEVVCERWPKLGQKHQSYPQQTANAINKHMPDMFADLGLNDQIFKIVHLHYYRLRY